MSYVRTKGKKNKGRKRTRGTGKQGQSRRPPRYGVGLADQQAGALPLEAGLTMSLHAHVGTWLQHADTAARDVALPDRDREALLHGGSLLWALTPLIPGGQAARAIQSIVGAAGAELAIRGSAGGESERLRSDSKTQLLLISQRLHQLVEAPGTLAKVKHNYSLYEDWNIAAWHTIFPDIGYQNGAQIRQQIEAAMLSARYGGPGQGIAEHARADRAATIAALAECWAEAEREVMRTPAAQLSLHHVATRFNASYPGKKAKISGRPVERGHEILGVSGDPADPGLFVYSGYRALFEEAAGIAKLTIYPGAQAKEAGSPSSLDPR